jgi:hypothetical protein
VADRPSDQQKNKAGGGPPAEIDHTYMDQFRTDHIADKLSEKETGNGY